MPIRYKESMSLIDLWRDQLVKYIFDEFHIRSRFMHRRHHLLYSVPETDCFVVNVNIIELCQSCDQNTGSLESIVRSFWVFSRNRTIAICENNYIQRTIKRMSSLLYDKRFPPMDIKFYGFRNLDWFYRYWHCILFTKYELNS